MDRIALRVRDRYLIQAAMGSYTDRVASDAQETVVVRALLEGFWEPRVGSTDKEAFLGITKAIGKLFDLFRRAPQAWEAIKRSLGLEELEGLGLREKAKILGAKLRELGTMGRKALQAVFHKIGTTFPLSLFFVPENKAPGLTDLIARILLKSPLVRKVLDKIHGGAHKVDTFLHCDRPCHLAGGQSLPRVDAWQGSEGPLGASWGHRRTG